MKKQYLNKGGAVRYLVCAALILMFIMTLEGLAYCSETRTFITLEAGGKPATGTVKFISYYNNDNNYILTEDSFNSPYSALIENGGYFYAGAYVRSEGFNWSPTHAASGDAYTVWVSATGNNSWGTASGAYNDIAAHFTTPGASANRLVLSSANYLGEPGSFTATPGANKVLLKWTPVAGASGYRLYRRLANTPDNDDHWRAYYKVANIPGGTTSYYIDNTASDGTNYWYILVAEATGPARIGPHTDEYSVIPTSTGAPSLESLNPTSGSSGTLVTIKGVNLGTAAGTVEFNGVKSTNVNWGGGGTVVTAEVPSSATSGPVYLINSSGLVSNGINFTKTGSVPPVYTSGFVGAATSTTGIKWSWNDITNEANYIVASGTAGATAVSTLLAQNTISWEETTGLATNTAYTRHIDAMNADGTTEGSNDLCYTLANPPTNLVTTGATSGSISISWSAAAQGGNNGYIVERAPDNAGAPGTWATIEANLAATATTDANGLTSGTYYWYRVYGKNGDGIANSTPTNQLKAQTASIPPSPPLVTPGFVGAATSSTGIRWSWTDITNEANYIVADGTTGNSAKSPLLGSNVISWEETVGLTPNSVATRHVDAINATATTEGTNDACYTLASNPTGLATTAVTATTVSLTWEAGNASRYKIERSLDGTTWTTIAAWAANVTGDAYNDTGLTSSTTYEYRIWAYNAEQIDSALPSNVVITKTLTPVAPPLVTPGFVGAATSSTSIRWSWTDITNEANYIVADGITGNSAKSPLLGLSVISWEETVGLTPNSVATRHVDAINPTATTEGTNDACYTLANPPTGLATTGATSGSISLSWSAAAVGGNNGYIIERAPNNFGVPGTWATIEPNGLTTTYESTGLNASTIYWFRVYGKNGDGIVNPTPTNQISGETLAIPPSPPLVTQGFVGAATSSTSIRWSWTDITNEANYIVADGTTGNSAKSPLLGLSVISWEETVGLTPNSVATRHVDAINPTATTEGTNDACYTLASNPTGLATTAVTALSVNLSWTAGDATRYRVDHSIDGTNWTTRAAWTDIVTGNTYTDSGLLPLTPHWYRIWAYNAEQRDSALPSNIVFTTTASAGGTAGASFEGSGGMMVAYPNPFNPNDGLNPLKMQFHAGIGNLDIFIIDSVGRVVQKYTYSYLIAADDVKTWDGSSVFGGKVSNGIYLIRIVQGGKLIAKGKVIVINK